jgi:hypothetical protein
MRGCLTTSDDKQSEIDMTTISVVSAAGNVADLTKPRVRK